jgi:hypothetical protein
MVAVVAPRCSRREATQLVVDLLEHGVWHTNLLNLAPERPHRPSSFARLLPKQSPRSGTLNRTLRNFHDERLTAPNPVGRALDAALRLRLSGSAPRAASGRRRSSSESPRRARLVLRRPIRLPLECRHRSSASRLRASPRPHAAHMSTALPQAPNHPQAASSCPQLLQSVPPPIAP